MTPREARLGYQCMASANLPIFAATGMRIQVFGASNAEPDIVALIHKREDADPTEAVVRLHSACLTGDVFGSMKCDCGAQLRIALDRIARADYGIILYLLRHEGRGIGLANKVRAYALQDQGMDTVEANVALGFEPDERTFEDAADVLLMLGVRRVRLLTNNPDKTDSLSRSGVHVVEQLEMDIPATEYNRGYLEVKRRFFGHTPLRDPITGCLTPEAFAEIFNVQVAGAVRRKSRLSSISLVVSPYADVKARFGAAAVDHLMLTVAGALKTCVRRGEPLVRDGDDRFIVMLQDADLEVAERVALRMKNGVVNTSFAWEGHAIPLEVTVQTTLLEPSAMPPEVAEVG